MTGMPVISDDKDVRGEEGRALAMKRFAAKGPISLENECRAWRVLAAACEARLASLPTTADEVKKTQIRSNQIHESTRFWSEGIQSTGDGNLV